MKYGMEDFRYGMEMEWKKIACMEYGKIVFHSIPCPGITDSKRYVIFLGYNVNARHIILAIM